MNIQGLQLNPSLMILKSALIATVKSAHIGGIMSDKVEIVSELHNLQNRLYDAREYLAELPIGRHAKELSTLFDMILKCETQLATVLDMEHWS